MGKQQDPVWDEWKCSGKDVDVDGKKYAECEYCWQRLQVNFTRFKRQLVVHCLEAP